MSFANYYPLHSGGKTSHRATFESAAEIFGLRLDLVDSAEILIEHIDQRH